MSGYGLTLNSVVPYIIDAARIAVILALAWLASRGAHKIVDSLRAHTVRKAQTGGANEVELQKRVNTMTRITARAFSTLIWTVAILMVLREMHFDVEPLIAGAGVAGIAIGFGAQSLIKDVLSGMFMLVENQLRINDVAVINGTGGLVEEINLRTTVLRGENGAAHVFPNGSITQLSNLTRDFSYAVFNVTVQYSQDLDRVMRTIGEIAAELRGEKPWSQIVLDPIEMLGVDALADAGPVIKFRLRTAPMKQWSVAREMNLRIKRRFEEVGIALAFPTQTIHIVAEAGQDLREELRAAVREVLSERDKAPATGPVTSRPSES